MNYHQKLDKHWDFIVEEYKSRTLKDISHSLDIPVGYLYRYVRKKKFQTRPEPSNKIEWTPSMVKKLRIEFPREFTRVLAKELGVSPRSVIRKARELGIDKIPNFLDINRKEITRMATEAHPPASKEQIEQITRAGINTRFKSGVKRSHDNNAKQAVITKRERRGVVDPDHIKGERILI